LGFSNRPVLLRLSLVRGSERPKLGLLLYLDISSFSVGLD
jgi:hypothetical protein